MKTSGLFYTGLAAFLVLCIGCQREPTAGDKIRDVGDAVGDAIDDVADDIDDASEKIRKHEDDKTSAP